MTARNNFRALLSIALLAAFATTVSAQPSTADAPTAQTHGWNDVSHINGQLVPVGESNSYVKEFRRTNVSTNPIGLITGFYGLSASYAINNHVAIRGDVNYYRPIETDMTGFELGIGAPIYLRRTYQGAFIEPGLIVRRTQSEGAYESGASTTVGPQVLFGWHWTWDSGLNVAAAFGAGRDMVDDSEPSDEYSSDESDLFVNGYFRVGYSF